MPPRGTKLVGAFDHRNKGEVSKELALAGDLQARLLQEPGNGTLAEEFAQLMSELGRHDMSLRIAGSAAALESPSTWRALGAVSGAFADRVEIREALVWAEKSQEACAKAKSNECPEHEAVRLRLYVEELRTGVKALENGADPKYDPDGFRREMGKTHRGIRLRREDK